MGARRVPLAGQRFGIAAVIEPEVRVNGERCARLRCDCGTVYLAPLRRLYAGQRGSCGCRRAGRPRRKGGYVSKARNGYTVVVYVGHYKTRQQAEAVARRARAYLAPDPAGEAAS